MLAKYAWIADERQYFGQPNSAFDLTNVNFAETGQRIEKLKDTCNKLSKSVNQRAMNMLGQTEDQVSSCSFNSLGTFYEQNYLKKLGK